MAKGTKTERERASVLADLRDACRKLDAVETYAEMTSSYRPGECKEHGAIMTEALANARAEFDACLLEAAEAVARAEKKVQHMR
jgi:hypothetical protein